MKGSWLCVKVVMHCFLSLIITCKLSAPQCPLWESKEMKIRNWVWTIDWLVTSHFCVWRWLLYGQHEVLCNKTTPSTFSPSLYFVSGWWQFILQHVRIPCTGYCNSTSVTFRQGPGKSKNTIGLCSPGNGHNMNSLEIVEVVCFHYMFWWLSSS